MRSRRVIGIDLSITSTGIAIGTFGSDGDFSVNTVTEVLGGPPTKEPGIGDNRFMQIVNSIWVLCEFSRDDFVMIEDFHVGRNSGPAIKLGILHGALRMTFLDNGLQFYTVSPSVLKKFATGKGNSNKTDMAVAAVKAAGIEFKNSDQCDSWWLAQYGARVLEPDNTSLLARTKVQLSVIDNHEVTHVPKLHD